MSDFAASLTLRRSAEILAAKGGVLADITIGDALELMDREAEMFTCPTRDHKVFYRMLRELGAFGSEAPQRTEAPFGEVGSRQGSIGPDLHQATVNHRPQRRWQFGLSG